MINRY